MLCSCHRDPVWQSLDVAESIMEEDPDSALVLLTDIDGSTLTGETQARHALLLSQAYDKNYIDLTNDSLISIAYDYFTYTGNERYKMLSHYYLSTIHMNQCDYSSALSVGLDGLEHANNLNDLAYAAKFEFLIARAYLFSYGQQGADEHLHKALEISRHLNREDWVGLAFINLANLSLQRKDFISALEYIDSAKSSLPKPSDATQYELLAYLGLNQYDIADSLYRTITQPNIQTTAYHILISPTSNERDRIDELEHLQPNASREDSIEIAGMIVNLAISNNDYERAWRYTDVLLQESSHVISNLSANSLYQITLEHESRKASQLQISHTRQTYLIIILIALSISVVVLLLYILTRRKAQILKFQNELLRITGSYAELKEANACEINELKATEAKTMAELESQREQTLRARIASRELFMSKYDWIEQLGKIYLESIDERHAKNTMTEIKAKLKTTKSKRFIPDTIDIINRYRDNILTRIDSRCPQISSSERDILALLCANLSPRIIAFILNIIPQSVYNAKSSIKRKIESSAPDILAELSDVFTVKS